MTAPDYILTSATLPDRLAETEYLQFRDPSYTVATDFGVFISHADFPGRRDCNQLFNCRCAPERVVDLLRELDRLYKGRDLPFQKLSGHDPSTYATLEPILSKSGWKFSRTRMMVFEVPPELSPNPAVQVRSMDPFHPDVERQYIGTRVEGTPDPGFVYHRSQLSRMGGEWLAGYLGGEPVGTTGWFLAGAIARFRWVGTREESRRRGVATTLIRYVQEHRTVQAQDALTIHCNDEETIRLYERLGFRVRGWMWEALRV